MAKAIAKKEKNPKSQAIDRALLPVGYLFVFQLPLIIFCEIFHLNLDSTVNSLLSELCIVLAAIAAAVKIGKITGDPLKNNISVKNFDIALVLIVFVLTYSGGEVLDNIIGHLLSGFMNVKENRSLSPGIVELVCGVICAPIFEEMMFRYSMKSALKERFGVKFIVLFSSAIFALVHFYNIQGLFNVFVQAIFLMIVYYYTGNLLITIAVHAIHNASCMIPIEDHVYYTVNGFVLSTPVWFAANAVITVITFVLFFKYFVPRYIKNKEQKPITTGE